MLVAVRFAFRETRNAAKKLFILLLIAAKQFNRALKKKRQDAIEQYDMHH